MVEFPIMTALEGRKKPGADIGNENVGNGKRILRVHEGFGRRRQSAFLYDTNRENAISRVFMDGGFEIVEGGVFNPANPLEFGIAEQLPLASYARDQQIARKVGIAMPENFAPKDILSTPAPVVAKLLDVNRGVGKYLLETEQQKTKFLAWASVFSTLNSLYSQGQHGQVRYLLSLGRQLGTQAFQDAVSAIPADAEYDELKNWVFEEYIQTPGKFDTSIRIAVDAMGDIHFGHVARSSKQKGSQKITSSASIADSGVNGLRTSFLENPESPYYLGSKKITSNIAQGGGTIFLNGRRVSNESDRRALRDLGINPDKPEIPEELLPVACALGKEFREYFPFTAVDLMKRIDGTYVMLENNIPDIDPLSINLPRNTITGACEIELLKRIIAKLPGS